MNLINARTFVRVLQARFPVCGTNSDHLRLLGDHTRIRILFALKEKEMCTGDIAVLLNMTKSAVSHQLAVMRNMHQVRARREGKNIFYSLDDHHIVDIIEEAFIHMTHVDE